jgi:hypothetical protein
VTTRRRTVVLVVLAVAAVALGASAVAAFRAPDPGSGGSPSQTVPTGPEVAGGPAEHTDQDYWTDERMRGARPAPMPTPPEGP